MTFVNATSFDFYFDQKISRAILIRGTIDHLHGNNPFLELEQSYVPNSTSCSTNSMDGAALWWSLWNRAAKTGVEQSQTPPYS